MDWLAWPGALLRVSERVTYMAMKRQFFNDAGHAHYLTFSCFHRQQLLTDDNIRMWFIQSVNQVKKQFSFKLWAWVIMPEHVHLLLCPEENQYSISRIQQSIKGPFARRVITYWREHSPHRLIPLRVKSGKRISHRLWQAGGGFDRNLYKMDRVIKAIEYIEYNPVRRGLASVSTEWRWSSARAHNGICEFPLNIDLLD